MTVTTALASRLTSSPGVTHSPLGRRSGINSLDRHKTEILRPSYCIDQTSASPLKHQLPPTALHSSRFFVSNLLLQQLFASGLLIWHLFASSLLLQQLLASAHRFLQQALKSPPYHSCRAPAPPILSGLSPPSIYLLQRILQ